MNAKRKVEVFSTGCRVCNATVEMVRRMACPDCEVTVLVVHEAGVSARAEALGIRSIPAVAIDGQLAACCAGRGPDEGVLRAAGLE